MMTHHFVMTSSLRIKNFKIDKFGDFSSQIDFITTMVIFRDFISLIINQCEHRRPKRASVGHKVSASRAAQASEARLYLYIDPGKIAAFWTLKTIYWSRFHKKTNSRFIGGCNSPHKKKSTSIGASNTDPLVLIRTNDEFISIY